jgi:hypothetical protein
MLKAMVARFGLDLCSQSLRPPFSWLIVVLPIKCLSFEMLLLHLPVRATLGWTYPTLRGEILRYI